MKLPKSCSFSRFSFIEGTKKYEFDSCTWRVALVAILYDEVCL